MRATLVCVLCLLGPVTAEEALDAALLKLRTAPRAETDATIEALLASKPDRAAVLTRLGKPFGVAAGKAGWIQLEATDEKGVTRPFELYVPESIVGKVEPVPLVVALHGGVSRPEFVDTPGQRSAAALWVASADTEGFVIACPAGRADCVWWTEAGAAHVRAVIRETKRRAPIDDDAVFGTGFSDGGSGCYYLAMAEPVPFAGFLPMNGHPAVASRASGKPLYIGNLRTLPNFVAMTQDDGLYPAVSILPHLQAAMQAGARMHIVSYPRGGHRPVYFDEQRAAFERLVTDTPRDPHPREFSWKCADPAQGRVAWAEVLAIGVSEQDPAATPDINVMSVPGRVRIGISVDQKFSGEGVRVTAVSRGMLAEQLKLQVGDVVVSMDGKGIGGLGDLRVALAKKKFGDDVALVVKRGEESVAGKGRFPAFKSEPIYLRDKPTAEFALQSEGNRVVVRCRNVRRFRLRLPPVLFGDGEFALAVNGARVEPRMRVLSLEDILRDYAQNADSGRVFGREAIVSVP